MPGMTDTDTLTTRTLPDRDGWKMTAYRTGGNTWKIVAILDTASGSRVCAHIEKLAEADLPYVVPALFWKRLPYIVRPAAPAAEVTV